MQRTQGFAWGHSGGLPSCVADLRRPASLLLGPCHPPRFPANASCLCPPALLFAPTTVLLASPPPNAAIATSEWTGVPLRQLLLAAGVRPEARFIHFRHVALPTRLFCAMLALQHIGTCSAPAQRIVSTVLQAPPARPSPNKPKCCSGPKGEVAGGDGTYATSVPLWKVGNALS